MPTPIPISSLSTTPSISDNDLMILSHKTGPSSYSSYKTTIANLRQSSNNTGGAAVFGSGNVLSGTNSIAFGLTNTSSANYSTTLGCQNNITGVSSYYNKNTAVGYKNTITNCQGANSFGTLNTISYSRKSSILGDNNTLSGSYSTVSGYYNSVTTSSSLILIGNTNTLTSVSGVIIGSHNTGSYMSNTISIGTYNTGGYSQNVTIGHHNTNSGSYSLSIGKTNTTSSNGISIGKNNTSISSGTIAIGSSCYSSNYNSVAIGAGATSRLYGGINLSGPVFARKDNGETPSSGLFPLFCGSESVVLSKIVNLKTTATTTLSIIYGSAFFVEEVGLIITSGSAPITAQPYISFSSLLSSIQTSSLANANDRQKFTTLLTNNGQGDYFVSLTAQVDTAATGSGTLMGRFYWKGFLIEV